MSLRKLWNSLRGSSVQPDNPSEPRPSKAKTKPVAKRGILDLVSSGPHAGLCRQIKKSSIRSVLEIGIGDGSRAQQIINVLEKSDAEGPIRYHVIDQFEMAGGSLSLKDYHKQLRNIGVKPNLIPMPTAAGIARFANTVGVVDLVILEGAELCDIQPQLQRILSPSAMVFQYDGENYQLVQSEQKQKAA